MRVIDVGPRESYYAHKTLTEFFEDIKQPEEKLKKPESFAMWLDRIQDETRFHKLLMHGRKVVGMVWGRRPKGEAHSVVIIEGKFLRRAYKDKFQGELDKLVGEITKGFEKRYLVIPPGQDIMDKYKVIGTIVEEAVNG